MLAAIIMFVAAAALGSWSTWHHLGRTKAARAWTRNDTLKMFFFPSTPYSVLVGRPLLAIALAAAGVLALAPAGSAVQVLAAMLFLVTLVGLIAYGFFRPRIPNWAKPAWYRAGEKATRG